MIFLKEFFRKNEFEENQQMTKKQNNPVGKELTSYLRFNSACWVIFMLFCRLLIFFPKSTFLKNSFRNTIRMSDSLDPDQAKHFVGPDLVPNCL